MRITRTSRDLYQFTSDFFRPDGGVTFQDYASARRFAAQLSAQRTKPVPASDIYAMQLIDEALRVLVSHFAPPAVMDSAVTQADENLGPDSVTTTEKKFVSEFPPDNVYRGDEKVDEYIARITNGRIQTVEELIYIFNSLQSPQRKATAILLVKALVAEERPCTSAATAGPPGSCSPGSSARRGFVPPPHWRGIQSRRARTA